MWPNTQRIGFWFCECPCVETWRDYFFTILILEAVLKCVQQPSATAPIDQWQVTAAGSCAGCNSKPRTYCVLPKGRNWGLRVCGPLFVVCSHDGGIRPTALASQAIHTAQRCLSHQALLSFIPPSHSICLSVACLGTESSIPTVTP